MVIGLFLRASADLMQARASRRLSNRCFERQASQCCRVVIVHTKCTNYHASCPAGLSNNALALKTSGGESHTGVLPNASGLTVMSVTCSGHSGRHVLQAQRSSAHHHHRPCGQTPGLCLQQGCTAGGQVMMQAYMMCVPACASLSGRARM